MNDVGLWQNSTYVHTVSYVMTFFLVFGSLAYYLQRRDPRWIGVWAGIKSWVYTSPIVFLFAALPSPWPLLFIIFTAIIGAKTFFRMTGMYHRSWFVWLTYIFIIIQGYSIYRGHDRFFNIMPMIFLGAVCLVPLVLNNFTHMVQYIALSLINFILMGWGYMHLGRIVQWQGGPLIALYLVILFEFCEASNYSLNRSFGHTKPISNITTRFSLEGFLGSIFLTTLLAWGLRGMLPDRSEPYWITAGLTVSIVGRMGGLIFSTIRRDLNVKESGTFIIGRDDLLTRIDKPIFAAPLIYFLYLILQGTIKL